MKRHFPGWHNFRIESREIDHFDMAIVERDALSVESEGPSFVPVDASSASLSRMLGCLAADRGVVVVPERIPSSEKARLVEGYPDFGWLGERKPRPGMPRSFDVAIPTSGSTGSPKLVATDWERVARGIERIDASQDLSQIDSTGLLLPPHYSFAFVNQVLWSLWKGARLVLTRGLATPVVALDELRERRVGMVCMVGQQIRALHKLGLASPKYALPDVRVVNFAGGPFPIDAIDALRALFPAARFVNNYGCTEAFPRVSCRHVDPSAPGDVSDVGVALKDVELEIRGDEGERLPADAIGRIHVRGPSVAAGVIAPDGSVEPFSEDGWVATGDMGALAPDGQLRVYGRGDQIIKVGGERISLLKVETVLRDMADVEDALVIGFRGENGEEWACAAVKASTPPTRPTLVSHLQANLPRAGWPREIRVAPEWPLLSNGKPDRKYIAERITSGDWPLVWNQPAGI